MVAYATSTVYDGKWKVTVWRRYEPGTELPPKAPDLRQLLADNYSASILELASILLEQVLHCQKVHVELLSGEGIYAERLEESHATE